MRVRLFGLVVWSAWMMAANPLAASESPAVAEESRSTPVAIDRAPQSVPAVEVELLRRVQSANEDLYASLQSFVCDESILRTRENLAGAKSRRLDNLTARVSFENGREQYSEVRQNGRVRSGLSDAGGAWSEGEFGTLLRQTQQLLKTQQVAFRGFGNQDGAPAAFFRFEVAGEDSPWSLVVKGRTYKLPFRTDVAVEIATGHILFVRREAANLPPELFISEIEWAVKMETTDLGGSHWLLPTRGEYAVSYAGSDRTERNQMNFGNYRRYGSEVALRFDSVK